MTPSDFEGDPDLLPYLTLDDRPGPAARISRDRALAMVDAALAELPPVAAAPRRRSLARPAVVAAGVVLSIAFGAAAARWYFPELSGAPKPADEAPAVAPKAARRATPIPAPAPEPVVVPEEVAPSEAPEAVRSSSESRVAPEDLLQKANRLRTQGRFRDAAQTYSSVAERYPNTLSAYVAQVAAASIELEHLSNPNRARRLFERALREHPEGALDLEARQGLATAYRDLGQKQAEVQVLRRLIDMHRGSPAARRGVERLKELGVE